MENRIHIKQLHEYIGETVTVAGFVRVRRDHGKLIFIDLHDETGEVQVVFNPKVSEEAHGTAETLRPEWVIQLEVEVKERPEKMQNADEENGDIECAATGITVLSEAETPPFEVTEDTSAVGEEVRIKNRYIDLRTERMQKNLRIRSEFLRRCREFLFNKEFTEIETPLLTKSTPEGSRDFVVPSRLHPGKFYALPQSPQQYKQLLMAGGFERYFQVARAVRDEDLRADRGFEHTQLDIEMAFVNQEMVMQTIEEMMIAVAEGMGHTIKEKPFPRISYKEALEKYGDDKFDVRTDEEKEKGILAYVWVVDFPFFEKTDDGKWTFSHNPFSQPKEEHLEWLMEGKNIGDILTTQYDLVCNGFESGGGSVRAHRPEVLRATYAAMGYSEEETEASVGHMLKAFSHGTPPHGGIALGIERNIMNLTGEKYLRDVQAFPMTSGGQTAVMDAPSELTPAQLVELGISVTKKED